MSATLRPENCLLGPTQSPPGVVAAILIADGAERTEIVALARTPIEEQRAICSEEGAFKSHRCTERGRAALGRK